MTKAAKMLREVVGVPRTFITEGVRFLDALRFRRDGPGLALLTNEVDCRDAKANMQGGPVCD